MYFLSFMCFTCCRVRRIECIRHVLNSNLPGWVFRAKPLIDCEHRGWRVRILPLPWVSFLVVCASKDFHCTVCHLCVSYVLGSDKLHNLDTFQTPKFYTIFIVKRRGFRYNKLGFFYPLYPNIFRWKSVSSYCSMEIQTHTEF